MIDRRYLLVPGLTAFFLLTACERPREEAGELTEAPAIEDVTQWQTASLDEMNGSGLGGEVRVRGLEGGTEIELTIDGALEGQTYVANVHRGECGNDLGTVKRIGEFTATAGENLISTTIDPATLEAGLTYFVQVRGPDEAPVACATLPLSSL